MPKRRRNTGQEILVGLGQLKRAGASDVGEPRDAESPTPVSPQARWSGRIVGVQPRIKLTRSFDQRYHEYLGFVLRVEGAVKEEPRTFTVAVGPAAHAKHAFRVGGHATGVALGVDDPEHAGVDFHRASKLTHDPPLPPSRPVPGPPWHDLAPPLPIYRERGHRRLAAAVYEKSCLSCRWGAKMPTTLIVDQWKPDVRRYRKETFCYGPKDCAIYRPGPTRKVPGRRGMSWEEEDWVDEEAVRHRRDSE